MDICRYVPFNRFCEMLFSQKLTLVSPEKWSDKYENYLLQICKINNEVQQLKNDFEKENNLTEFEAQRLIDFANYVCKKARCICFSMSIDSEVMWNSYNYNRETIMWKTTDKKVSSINQTFDLAIVKYDLETVGINSYLKLLGLYNNRPSIKNSWELFAHKRRMFEYEHEIRVIDIYNTEVDKEYSSYLIPSIKDFVDGVIVHPLADESYVEAIKVICDHFEIPFLGKSKIYDLTEIYK